MTGAGAGQAAAADRHSRRAVWLAVAEAAGRPRRRATAARSTGAATEHLVCPQRTPRPLASPANLSALAFPLLSACTSISICVSHTPLCSLLFATPSLPRRIHAAGLRLRASPRAPRGPCGNAGCQSDLARSRFRSPTHRPPRALAALFSPLNPTHKCAAPPRLPLTPRVWHQEIPRVLEQSWPPVPPVRRCQAAQPAARWAARKFCSRHT